MTFATNKKALHNFLIEEKIEAGIQLQGTEVKSIRKGNIQLSDSYVMIKDGQAYLYNAHISPFDFGNRFNHDPTRPRKLLLHSHEILELGMKIQKERINVIPLRFYAKKRTIKVELGLGKSKKKHDKRESIKEKEVKRDMDRATKKYK